MKVKIRRGVDVTAHRRALLFRAGTVAVLAAGALIGLAAPAHAAGPEVVIAGAGDVTLTVGGSAQTVNVQVKNQGDLPALKISLTIDIPGDLGLTVASKPNGCSGSGTHVECDIDAGLGAGQTKNIPIGIAPPAQSSIPAGQQKSGGGQVILTDGGSDTKNFQAVLKAQAVAAPPTTTQAAPQTVTEVTGNVTDSTTGKGIKGATVVLEDNAGKTRQTSTQDDKGFFRFTPTDANPIAPGTLKLTAGANGYDNFDKTITAAAGKPASVKLGLTLLADSATPVPPPTAGDPAIVQGQSAGGVDPGNTKTNNASNDSGGGVSWILIALGVLLVGFGIVAIVMLLRRRGDDDDDENVDEPAPRRGPGPRPAYVGPGTDPTMVGAMGAPTMISRGGSNDATAIVRPTRGGFDDVPPDPYGAPLPAPGGYPSAGGYDDRAGFASGGYNGGGGNGYGRPAPGPAVDPYAPDYNNGDGGANGYADSTQRYEPGTGGNNYGGGANGYNNNPPTGGYGPGAGPGGAGGQSGYGGANGYDGPSTGGNNYGGGPRDRGGYDDRGGPPTTLGGFAGGDRGGYDGPQAGGGYDGPKAGGGYDERGGYGPQAGGGYDDRGGYDGPQAGGGYGDRGGYGPQAGNGYDGPQAGGGGYDDRGGYGPQAGGGYDDRGGYGPQAGGGDYDGPYAGRGGYGPSGGGAGYEPASGYERDGYERVPEPPRAGNGYGPGGGAPAGGGAAGGDYDQRGGYGPSNNGGGDYDDARAPGRGGNGNRRSLDWLDD
ncbi:hypothetical protein GCM10018962_14060 [Dactylosporangium matsuzakiense]|uniref:Carboxypeptidase family protein n=1 Tax=Dactylosporangium matsuzakiense TaxID=53360 RepID=A0A9W6NRA0_9ACTN|nr:hypothetical protein GCM10017581_077150 [Dactylosporangium matsuzakiense]